MKFESGFNFYKPYTYLVRDAMLRTNKLKPGGKVARAFPYQRIFIEKDQNFQLSGELMIWEDKWLDSPVYLYPEDETLVNDIRRGEFHGRINNIDPTGLDRRLSQFSIAVPSATRFNGESISGIFVSILHPSEVEQMVKDFVKKYKIRKRLFIPARESKVFQINYRLNDDTDTETVCEPLSGLLDYMATNKNKTQNEVIKFVLGFIVYICAAENVIENVSSIKLPKKIQGRKTKKKPQSLRINYSGPRDGTRMHFRNLVHEKYYQLPEFQNYEPGTRWTLVKGSLKEVGRDESVLGEGLH